MASETLTIPGSIKTIRAKVDLQYRGRTISGIRRTRIDGEKGAYEIIMAPGAIAEVDQVFAKEVVMSGKAELLEGGMCEVVEEVDGFHRYTDWRVTDGEGAVYEKVEYLKNGAMAGGPYWGPGFKARVDISQCDRASYCFEDETPNQWHAVRVLKPSPKRVKMDAAEQSHKVSTMWKKLYPDTPATA
jgi:hypothetical protein